MKKDYLFLCYNRCSTCSKAKKWLEENKIDFEIRDIVIDNPNEDEIRSYFANSNLEIKRFFNTSGLVYKELDLKNKLADMTDEEKISLLASNGKLIKRPILFSKYGTLVGFKEEEWKEYFKNRRTDV